MHLSPEEEAQIRAEFGRLANMSQAELRAWLETPQSRKVGMVRKGETESVGRQSAKKILKIRDTAVAGVSVGIADSIPELLDAVDGYLAEGYVRIKLKIQPGWDLEPVKAVRERFGDVLLQTDANTAYTLGDWQQLAKLDAFDLLLHEQPLEEEDVRGHAQLARLLRTPICLDESIVSARAAADAIALGACSIINIKPEHIDAWLQPEAGNLAALYAIFDDKRHPFYEHRIAA